MAAGEEAVRAAAERVAAAMAEVATAEEVRAAAERVAAVMGGAKGVGGWAVAREAAASDLGLADRAAVRVEAERVEERVEARGAGAVAAVLAEAWALAQPAGCGGWLPPRRGSFRLARRPDPWGCRSSRRFPCHRHNWPSHCLLG